MDSGATITIVRDKSLLEDAKTIKRRVKVFKKKARVYAESMGYVYLRFANDDGEHHEMLLKVIYVPNAPANLISQSQLDKKGI